ncbi:MAG: hypothetical protein CYPHOPRED_000840 [Cyphobasidiales sp. Tagirdzhanova-0007]|nr:MAG: hypothetical protein CYPHOPRED_000840 [Cyphobasidiales sp. Tagirdzhanova-0007]
MLAAILNLCYFGVTTALYISMHQKIAANTPYTPKPVELSLVVYIGTLALLLLIIISTCIAWGMDTTAQDWKRMRHRREEEKSANDARIHHDIWAANAYSRGRLRLAQLAMRGGKALKHRYVGSNTWKDPYVNDPDLVKEVSEVGEHRNAHEEGADEEMDTIEEAQVENQILHIEARRKVVMINEDFQKGRITKEQRSRKLHHVQKKIYKRTRNRIQRQAFLKNMGDTAEEVGGLTEDAKHKLFGALFQSALKGGRIKPQHLKFMNDFQATALHRAKGGDDAQKPSAPEGGQPSLSDTILPAVPGPAYLPQAGVGMSPAPVLPANTAIAPRHPPVPIPIRSEPAVAMPPQHSEKSVPALSKPAASKTSVRTHALAAGRSVARIQAVPRHRDVRKPRAEAAATPPRSRSAVRRVLARLPALPKRNKVATSENQPTRTAQGLTPPRVAGPSEAPLVPKPPANVAQGSHVLPPSGPAAIRQAARLPNFLGNRNVRMPAEQPTRPVPERTPPRIARSPAIPAVPAISGNPTRTPAMPSLPRPAARLAIPDLPFLNRGRNAETHGDQPGPAPARPPAPAQVTEGIALPRPAVAIPTNRSSPPAVQRQERQVEPSEDADAKILRWA